MSQRFEDYHAAHGYAVNLARQLGREVGIERSKWFNKNGYTVHHLPKAENRYGFELRCEVVGPKDAVTDRDIAAMAKWIR